MNLDLATVVITLGSFAASFVNAAFATGGVYITLISSLWVLPVSAAIPLQSAFAAGSLVARISYFRQYIRWPLVAAFLAGSLLGVYLGARTFVSLPENLIQLLLGLLLVLLIWLPKTRWKMPFRHPFFAVGIVHSYLGTVFGVGGVLQPIMLRTDLNKLAITGTLAACLLGLDAMKVVSYVSLGFSYFDYIPMILWATAAGFLGTWAGKRVTHMVSEATFRKVFRWLITLVALRLVYKGLF